MNESLFSSEDYALYRFEYPSILFEKIYSTFKPNFRTGALSVLDLGCGTGLVTRSFLKFYPSEIEITLIDADAAMLQKAKDQLSSQKLIQEFHCSPAENIPTGDVVFDLILIGSAWHWMKPLDAMLEIERVLKSGGGVYIFEYQFPKALERSTVNDWIRQQFNQLWKPTQQKPRGTLKEITECFRNHPQFAQTHFTQFNEKRMHDARELSGVIFSQSRFQHYEQSLLPHEKETYRSIVEEKVKLEMNQEKLAFQYEYEGYFFRKRD